MRDGTRKKRGRKKAEVIFSLQGVEFDIDAITEIKKRKRRLRKKQSRKR